MDDVIQRKIQESYHPAYVFEAEGTRVMIATCKICGAAVLQGDVDDGVGPKQHYMWHMLGSDHKHKETHEPH